MILLAFSFPLPQLRCRSLHGQGRRANLVMTTLLHEKTLTNTKHVYYPRMSKLTSKDQEEQRPRSNLGVKMVNPKPRNGLISNIIDNVEKFLVEFTGKKSSQYSHFLCGNFAPVLHETPPTQGLTVFGCLPDCLNGQFFRIGPNPKFQPHVGYHWFDGDGMIHGLRIEDGKATYVSRYVKTSRLKQEVSFGSPNFFKIGDLKGFFGLLTIIIASLRNVFKAIDFSYGFGTGNTGLTYHHGNLLALHEADKPYVLKIHDDGDIETIGLLDYDNEFGTSFTAHPKMDPITGEMFVFGYSSTEPYVNYTIISKDAFMHKPVKLKLSEPVLMHDFAITEKYAIIMDQPLIAKPKEMFLKNKQLLQYDTTRNARFGIFPRYARNGHLMKWFELPNCHIAHTANAWEEEDTIVLICCQHESPLYLVDQENPRCNSCLYELRFNMATGQASQKKLSAASVEFPRVNESYLGRKQRYVYGAILDNKIRLTGIVKFDLHSEPGDQKVLKIGGNIEGVFHLGSHQFGSEAVFIPRHHPIDKNVTPQEDDGYLLLFAHDENIGKSTVIVIDAKTMSQDPVAVVELPNRVPYGFHALFVSEEQLQKQRWLAEVPNK